MPLKDISHFVQRVRDRAFELECKSVCCPQCVMTAVKETVGGVTDETIKLGHGLSGGSLWGWVPVTQRLVDCSP